MSFQYINPYVQTNIPMNQNGVRISNVPIVKANTTNPYQANFYNTNVIYPFNPLYSPKINSNYVFLGQFQSTKGENVYLFRLSNGHEVAIMPRKDEETIVKTFINAGSMNETDSKRGVMHADEHGVFLGSKNLKNGDVFRLTGQMGADTNASTDYAKVDYYISAPYLDEKNLQKSIEIQGDMLSNPAFEENAIQSEKGPICSEISMINDNPATNAYDKVIRNLFQIKSNSQNLVAGSIDTVQNLSRDDMVNYYKTYYTPTNLKTVVVGDVDVNKTIDAIAKNFTLKYNPTSPLKETRQVLNPSDSPVREDIKSSKTNFTTIYMAFAGPKPSDSKDFVIGRMLDYYISQCSSSDLKKALEKLDADYTVSAQKVGLNSYDPYAIVNVISTMPNDEQKALDAFYDAIQKLQTTPLSDDDMKAMHNYIEKAIELSNCDSTSICDLLGTCMLDNSMDLFTNYNQIANSITKEDIMNYVKKYYDLNKISIVIVHPSGVSDDEIKNNYSTSKYSLYKQNPNIPFCGTKKSYTESPEEMKLPNNTHLVINNTDKNLCIYNWCVNTPPIKPKNPNIPEVLRYMFQKGTNYLNQANLERIKELNGINADVYVNGRSIEISADCLPKNAKLTLDLMNELMYHPNLVESDFEDAKKYVKSMLKTSQKDANSNLLDNIYPGYFPTNAAKLKTIDELTLDDVKEFYRELLKSASSSFIATIPAEKNPNLKNMLLNAQNIDEVKFKDSVPKLTPIFNPNPKPNVIMDVDDLNQAQIYKSYKFPLSGNIEDEVKFEMVNTILGGSPNARLFGDLREKQNLAYSVSSQIQSFENTGILTLKIQTTTDNPDVKEKSYDNVKKSLEGFKKHTDTLSSELVSDEELEAAKMRLKQNIIGQIQNPVTETGLLAMNVLEPYGIKRIDKYIEAIDKVTKEDVLKAAQFIFSYNPTISILASENTINSQMEYLKTQGELSTAQ